MNLKEPNKSIDSKRNITDEEIFNLREKGLTYKSIANELEKQGKTISLSCLNVRCRKIYENKGLTQPKILKRSSISEISDEEILNLRKQGFTYKSIANEFYKKGKKISYFYIYTRCKQNGLEKDKVSDEEIFNLREEGLTYKSIANELQKKGKKISLSRVYSRCKKIYTDNSLKHPSIKRKYIISEISNDEIFKLREQGLTYDSIANELQKKGKKISLSFVYNRCKKIYKSKNLKEPKSNRKNNIDQISDEEIFEFREQGLSYNLISQEFIKQNKSISPQAIQQRCKKIYAKKELNKYIDEPNKILPKQASQNSSNNKLTKNFSEKQLAQMILNLMRTKNATFEQVQQIANIYNIDLEKYTNSFEER